MPFPWGQSTLPVSFTCPYCGSVKNIIRDTIPVCDCSDAEEQAAADRERMNSHHRVQEDARKLRMQALHARRRQRVK